MLNRLKHKLPALLFGLLAGVFFAVAPVQAQEGKAIRIGWTAWSDAEVVTKAAKQILEEQLGYKVELILADIGLQFQGIAKGDLDAMLMAWLPLTHGPYWEKFSDQVIDMGTIYGGAKLGWAVPAYIPESDLKTIEDLAKPEVKEKLDGKIQGIDPGSGLMQASQKVLEEYGLKDYNLISASDAAMTAALSRAIQRDEWIVVTAWSPHWMFARWDLRYLEDPKGALGGEEKVHAVSRKGFKEDFPRAAAFIENYKLSLEDLQGIMFKATESSYEEAVDEYLKANPEMIEQWIAPAKDLPQFGS